MARMLPPRYDTENINYGEKIIFDGFKKSKNTDSWIILHSVLQQKHIKNKFGEIDFIVLAPELGIFCLEVKGADRISRKDGVWTYSTETITGPKSYSKTESPFDQAHNNMFSLIGFIRKKLGKEFEKLNYGYGVIFPRLKFDKRLGADEEDFMIYDEKKMKTHTINKYVELLSKGFLSKNSRGERVPDEDDIEKVCSLLRGDFEFVPSHSTLLSESRDTVKKFTREQLNIFDSHRYNNQLIIRGGAGTGKTIIALESAMRAASDCKKTLLTCFNKNLGDWLKRQFSKKQLKYVTVGNIHAVLFDIIGFTPVKSFKDEAPMKVLEALEDGNIPTFDTLIVDEAQDLINDEYLDIFSLMVNGGLSSGNWMMFGDFFAQRIYTEKNEDESIEAIKSKAGINIPECRLDKNIRNASDVALAAVGLSGLNEKPFSIQNKTRVGVEINWYKNESEQITQIKKAFKYFTKRKYSNDSILVLSPFKFKNSIISRIKSDNPLIEDITGNHSSKSVKFSTIHGFKGLEAEHILVVDIDQISSPEMMELLYNAATRSTFSLTLTMDMKLLDLYGRRSMNAFRMYKDEI